MRTKFITLLLCLCPLLLIAQDYKKEGDELFQQAQYEKSIKKYKAYIAFAGEDPSVSKRIATAEKCNSLLSRAKSAEQAAAESSNMAKYEEASRLYNELYSLHSWSSYKSKASQLQKKADAIRIDQERAEKAEQERIAQERQRADSIRQEAQKERERQEQIKREEEKIRYMLKNSNITMKELLDHPLGVAHIQWTDNRNILYEEVKTQLENGGYSDNVYTSHNHITWHLAGSIAKELTLYYRVRYISLDWAELQNGGVDITYEIRWLAPDDSRTQEQKNVLEYLKNDIEKYGIVFTDTIVKQRESGYYTRKKEMKNYITYVCISKKDYKTISLKILYHLDSRFQTTQRYIVSKGESLSRIAQKYGVLEEDILKINPKVNQSGLSEGQIIYIPKKRQNSTYQNSQSGTATDKASAKKSQSVIDIHDMNNTTPFNVIKWKVDYSSNLNDAWFSEKRGLITDSKGWTSGMSENMGWYALHRFNRKQYTCNYLHTSNSLGRDGFGDNLGVKKAVRDRERSTLPIEDGYYVLDLRDWQGYKPLYLPYSQEFLKSKWKRGMIKFEYR